MGVEINISNSKIAGRVMNHADIGNNDLCFKLHNTEIDEHAVILEKLKIESVLKQLEQECQKMDKDSMEYLSIREILSVRKWHKKAFVNRVTKHLADFSKGVLASIIANMITK